MTGMPEASEYEKKFRQAAGIADWRSCKLQDILFVIIKIQQIQCDSQDWFCYF
jgi:hypothetical protein